MGGNDHITGLRKIATARGDARHTAADVSKAQKILSCQPQASLLEGLGQ